MTIAAVSTETTYALAGTNLGPFATVWPYETTFVPISVVLITPAGVFPLAEGGDWTIAPAGGGSLAGGGNVTLTAAPLTAHGVAGAWPAGTTLGLARGTTGDQPSAYGEASGFSPASSEQALDHVGRQVQDHATALGRAVRVNIGDTAPTMPAVAARANAIAGWDGAGNFNATPGPSVAATVAAMAMALITAALPGFALPAYASVNMGEIGPVIPANASWAYVNMGKTVHGAGSETLLNVQLNVTAATPAGLAEKDGIQVLVGSQATNVHAAAVVGGVGVNSTVFANGGSLPAVWGAVLSANVIPGVTGSATGLEIDMSIGSAGNQQANVVSLYNTSDAIILTQSLGLLVGNIGATYPITAGVTLAPTFAGYNHGFVAQCVVQTGMILQSPLTVGCVGVRFTDDSQDVHAANWGEAIRFPRALIVTMNSSVVAGSVVDLLITDGLDGLIIGSPFSNAPKGIYLQPRATFKVIANSDFLWMPTTGTLTPPTNGQLGFQINSNTSVSIVLRGTDGTTRREAFASLA